MKPGETDGATARRGGRVLRALGTTAAVMLVTVLLFALIEGLSSMVLFVREARQVTDLPSRVHAQHDTLVGWINQPNVRLTDLYGAGRSLTTNSRGFRATVELTPLPAAGRIRVVCSGDSFTLGYGVGDESTWCSLLATLDPRLETANLGHAGYGIDQAWLLYRREAPHLGHDVHVFAFIYDDFRRMALREFVGKPKPALALKDDSITITNVPVPAAGRFAKWKVNRGVFRELRSIDLASRVLGRLAGSAAADADDASGEAMVPVALAVFADIAARDRAAGVRTLFVYLPMSVNDVGWGGGFGARLAQEMDRRGLPFLDVRDTFHRLPHDSMHALYSTEWKHYSEAGHRLAARLILERLQQELVAPADRADDTSD